MDTEKTQPEWGIKLSKYIPIPQRVIMAILCFLAIINNYTLRICLSVAINKLVKETPHDDEINDGVCPASNVTHSSPSDEKTVETYNWSQELQGLILGSFYFGYIIGHVPAGMLSVKYGAKWVLGLGLVVAAILNLLTPIIIMTAGESSAEALIVVRAIMGLASGCAYPAMSALLAQWVPTEERGFLGVVIMGGGQIGSVIANAGSGMLLHYYTWPAVFYVFGITNVIWFIFYSLMCFSDPDSHPYIKPSEKEYLLKTMGRTGRRTDLPSTPWGAIFTSAAMWSLILAQIGNDWAFYVIASDLPKYLNDVIRFPIKENGLVSALPFFVMWFLSMVYGFLADVMYVRQWMSLTNIRKLWTFVAAAPCGIFLVLASYAECDKMLVVVFFCISAGLKGGYYPGIKLSPNDMSPNYSATVLAIVNGIGGITGVLAPYSVGWMTPDQSLLQWREVFWVAFIVLTVCTTPFYIWGTADVQEWNDPKPKE